MKSTCQYHIFRSMEKRDGAWNRGSIRNEIKASG